MKLIHFRLFQFPAVKKPAIEIDKGPEIRLLWAQISIWTGNDIVRFLDLHPVKFALWCFGHWRVALIWSLVLSRSTSLTRFVREARDKIRISTGFKTHEDAFEIIGHIGSRGRMPRDSPV